MAAASPSARARGVSDGGGAPALAQLLTPQEIATAWHVDVSTVRRVFQDEEGVLKLSGGNGRKRRVYVTIRIPAAVYERVMKERSR